MDKDVYKNKDVTPAPTFVATGSETIPDDGKP